MSIPIEAIRNVTRIIVHADCPDGIASAMILHDCLPDAEVVAVQYGPELEALEPGDNDLFCDICPPSSNVTRFVVRDAIVLDHHKGAKELVARFGDRGVFADESEEPGVSGAVLAYREVWLSSSHGAEDSSLVCNFAELAGIRDCWLKHSPSWLDACRQAEVLTFYSLQHWLGSHRPMLDSNERLLGYELYDRKIRCAYDLAGSGCYRLDQSTAVFNVDGRIVSDVAEAMRDVDPSVTLVVGFFYTVKPKKRIGGIIKPHMQLVFSLRSNSGAKLTAKQIAVANGGGGHEHAAGFTLDVKAAGSPIDLLQHAIWRAEESLRA